RDWITSPSRSPEAAESMLRVLNNEQETGMELFSGLLTSMSRIETTEEAMKRVIKAYVRTDRVNEQVMLLDWMADAEHEQVLPVLEQLLYVLSQAAKAKEQPDVAWRARSLLQQFSRTDQ
ncbi:MAG: hypothetical protein O3B86_17215, partial [Planctomycetota bacterium]|nr:hypothetical protein [Planctomycetota bacterium]